MRGKLHIACCLLWIVLAGALPAGANIAFDEFGPDAFTSLVLVFPLTILGFRLAGAHLTEKKKIRCFPRGDVLVLALCVFGALCFSAVEPVLIFLLPPCVVLYGVVRGVQAVQRGQGAKRFALGGAVVLLAVLVGINELVAFRPSFPDPGRLASATARNLQTINTAAVTYASTYENGFPPSLAVLGAPATGAPDCRRSDLVALQMAPQGNVFQWFGYVVEYRPEPPAVVRPSPGCPPGVARYTITARPLKYGAERYDGSLSLLPGTTLLHLRRGHQVPFERFTYATDETAVLRGADLGTSRPVTREEMQKWPPLH